MRTVLGREAEELLRSNEEQEDDPFVMRACDRVVGRWRFLQPTVPETATIYDLLKYTRDSTGCPASGHDTPPIVASDARSPMLLRPDAAFSFAASRDSQRNVPVPFLPDTHSVAELLARNDTVTKSSTSTAPCISNVAADN